MSANEETIDLVNKQIAEAMVTGEPLPQKFIDVAEEIIKVKVSASGLKLHSLGHNPPIDPIVVILLRDVIPDPLWDSLPPDATAQDFLKRQTELAIEEIIEGDQDLDIPEGIHPILAVIMKKVTEGCDCPKCRGENIPTHELN